MGRPQPAWSLTFITSSDLYLGHPCLKIHTTNQGVFVKNISRYELPLLLFTLSYIKKKAFSTDLCTLLFLPLMDLRDYTDTDICHNIYVRSQKTVQTRVILCWNSLLAINTLDNFIVSKKFQREKRSCELSHHGGLCTSFSHCGGLHTTQLTVSIFMQVCVCSCVHFVNPPVCYYKQMPCPTEGSFLSTT